MGDTERVSGFEVGDFDICIAAESEFVIGDTDLCVGERGFSSCKNVEFHEVRVFMLLVQDDGRTK